MGKTNKVSYKKHKWSGGKRKKSASESALYRLYGTTSRIDVWREAQQQQVPESKRDHTCPEAATIAPAPSVVNTYGRGKPVIQIEATFAPTCSQLPAEAKSTVDINWPNPDHGVEEHELLVETVPREGFKDLTGYRMVDINHVLRWAFALERHRVTCIGSSIEFVNEQRDGFNSTLTFKCAMCNKMFRHSTEKCEQVNKAFVWGTVTAGSYYTASAHVTNCMDIPTMSSNTFRSIEKNLGDVWQEHLTEEIRKAGEEERAIAISKGQINEDGVPYTTVYVDGSWLKRSYGHNYNSPSGMACIIGKETKKCLFLGVRNKYCYQCQLYEKKNLDPKKHLCFKNFNGPSTAMETDIVVEGFKKSEEMHGLQYLSFIGDGDSSVFANIRKSVPYGTKVTKIECKNHVVKNYTGALYKILSNTKLPLQGRNMLKPKLSKLTIVARKIIIQANKDPNMMRTDLRNAPYHVFGNHTNCKAYYCRWKSPEFEQPSERDTDLVGKMKACSPVVWALICAANDNVISKAHRLTNETTNVAENFMSVVNKFNCGKRLSLGKGGSYQRRVLLAGLSQTTGYNWHERAWTKASQNTVGRYYKKYLIQKDRIRNRQKLYTRIRTFLPKPQAQTDLHYGPAPCDPVDITFDELRKQGEEKLKGFQLSAQEILDIETRTKDQHDSDIYNIMRNDRLTASQFGMVCKRRKTTPCHNHVKQILYKNNVWTSDMKYGQKNEAVARSLFETVTNKKVERAGLFIDQEYGFLGASPDGIVKNENALLEIKCFPSLKRSRESIEDAARTRKNNFCLKLESGKLVMNQHHNYYYQIQGQLRVTNMIKCYFIGFIDPGTNLTVVEVGRDEEFIGRMMPKLVTFYKDCILPELILRRIPKNEKCTEISNLRSINKILFLL